MSLGKINAMANISDQTKTQRDEFAGSDTSVLGANRTSHLLFADRVELNEVSGVISIDGEEINSKAESELTSLYDNGASGNPDFPLDHSGSDYKYEGATDMLESAPAQSDKPNRLGPNLIPPSIDESGEVSRAESTNTATSPVTGRGFGVKLESRQDPNNFESLGSYLKRRRNEGVITIPKGEFVNDADSKYDWEA